ALACIEVADTLAALGHLASQHVERARAARSIPSLAIGGAVGKTTTKELTAAAARALFGATLSTAGSLNNLIGVPMTMLALSGEHRAMVIECGTNTRGEVARLTRIVAPDTAMVLNVDIEHSEGLGTLEEIADEESALFAGARRIAITCAEEPMVLARVPARLKKITFGESKSADVRLLTRKVVATGRARITIQLAAALVQGGISTIVETDIAMLGRTSALNAAAALAAAAAMSAEPLAPEQLRAIASALTAVQPVEGRLATTTITGIFVIDDTYNSNPRSVRAALAAAREVADGMGARLIVAFGDMLELGPMAKQAHADAIRDASAARPAAIVAVGPEMTAAASLATRARQKSQLEIMTAPDSDAAAAIVRRIVRARDVLLVKGSRGIRMERVIELLAKNRSS
ncbi:MAG TPA: Mur ligase family protein, partial [Candidatus Binataceae bacterium]